MFGTVIIDAYTEGEKGEIAFALDDLCSPCDSYGWSSAGIYCFWDYYTKEVLYIGLAADLCDRFKQHNGIKKVDNNSCKYEQITEYFREKEKIGYSIFVQSNMSQPITHRNQQQFKTVLGDEFSRENYVGKEGQEHIKQVEGILIESFKKSNGDYPIWNKMGGSIYGQNVATIGNYEIVKSFNDFKPNPLVSRCSLRELSENATYERYENYLHVIRTSMLILGMSFEKALEFHNNHDILNTYQEMIREKYFERTLKV